MEAIPEDPILEFQPDTLVALRKIYNLENGRMVQSVLILEEWIKKQTHFVNKNFSKEYLEKTIITCKGSVEKAKMKIDKLCTYKTLLPKFFLYTDVKSIFKNTENNACIVPLPKMTKEYQRIVVLKINDKEFSSDQFMEFYKQGLMISEYLKRCDYFNGIVIVEDFRETNLTELMSKINVIELHQIIRILLDGFGAKLKGIHILTESKVIDLILKMVKHILSPKLAQRIHIHRELHELYDIVDKNILPVDLGGNERSIQELQGEWKKALSSEDFVQYLVEMQASKTDESLRQTDTCNMNYMDIPGSFRTLSVD